MIRYLTMISGLTHKRSLSMRVILLLLWGYLAATGMAAPEPAATQQLANELISEKQYQSAAVEYRRLALTAKQAPDRAGFYWGAAHAYLSNHNGDLALKMLDYAEEASDTYASEATLLRLECALERNDTDSANFYAESLMKSSSEPFQHIARSRQARIALHQGNADTAATIMQPIANKQTEVAIAQYASGRNKSPKLGGFLGMVPGLGYAYAGEYANALRSLILNGLFIYGMVDTAEDESWGAFSIITFFELTWYTGSIYGGIDASNRYNQKRLQACIHVIDDQSQYTPNFRKLPAIVLKYQF